jgi:GxxExxY protein
LRDSKVGIIKEFIITQSTIFCHRLHKFSQIPFTDLKIKTVFIVEEPKAFYSNEGHFLMKEETYKIIGLAMEIHRIIGKGFLEIVYKDALEIEFSDNSILFEREKGYSIDYKGRTLKRKYIADFVVYNDLILEVKAQSGIYEEDVKQTINYLACSKSKLGLILNFGEDSLTFRRVILT